MTRFLSTNNLNERGLMASGRHSSARTASCSQQTTMQKPSTALRRIFFTAHPQFDVFVEKMNDIMDSVKTEWEAERLHPKRRNPRSSRSFEIIRNVVDNFYNDSALRLPLGELLRRIGEILHEDARFEEAYEDGNEATFEFVNDDFCADDVPMEIDDGLDKSLDDGVCFHN